MENEKSNTGRTSDIVDSGYNDASSEDSMEFFFDENSSKESLDMPNEESLEHDVEQAASESTKNPLEIEVKSVDGGEKNYSFVYKEEEFNAIYTTDHWKIMNSYKISSESDMLVICQALIDIHPIHGSDMESYRTADDMVYEWLQHNLAYELLPEDNYWRNKAKDVDFNPEDQGKSFVEIYEQRTGKEFDFSVIYGE